MAYADRHVWSSPLVDGSSTGDKAHFSGGTNRVQIHKLGVVLLDATTGAGVVAFDKLDEDGTRGSADVGEITVGINAQTGGYLYYEEDLTPSVLNVGEAVIAEVTDAFDANALITIEYSILDQDIGAVDNATAG